MIFTQHNGSYHTVFLFFMFLPFTMLVTTEDNNQIQYKKKFYVTESEQRMIEAIFNTTDFGPEMVDCYVYGDRFMIESTLMSLPADNVIVVVSDSTMKKITNYCVNAKYYGELRSDPQIFSEHMFGTFYGIFIYPGTKWCGAGDAADSYDDLGPEVEADMCCRTHDHCNDSIEAYDSKYGLKNRSPITKSHCRCDTEFQNCLYEANTRTSNRLGRIFFNILCMECFREDYPIIQCLEYAGSRPFRSCQKYELDEYEDPIWQFFDPKRYEPKEDYIGVKEDEDQEQKWIEQYEPVRLNELKTKNKLIKNK